MAKVRIGLIGCGGMAHAHVQALLTTPEVEIAAIVDPVPAALERVQQRYASLQHVPAFANHRDMLNVEPLDATVVVTPHSVHFEQVRDSLAAGLHVLCEKPFVADPAEARSLVEQADA